MDLSVLLTVPVMVAAVVLVIVSAVAGFAIGKTREVARKEEALADAEKARRASLIEMRAQHERKIDALAKTHADETAKLEQIHADHVERISGEHAELIRKLNESNNAHIAELEKEHERQTAASERRHAAEIEQIRKDNLEAIQALTGEHRQAVEALMREHQATLQLMRDEHSRLQAERDGLARTVEELSQTVAELNNRIKEARLNNMLSVSRSGEKLIRVVRSVQELATELDETSRAVTDGEYSFFAEIKDKRDKETVLSLAGGERAQSTEPPPAEGPVIENEVPPAQETGGTDQVETGAEAGAASIEGMDLDADAEVSGEADVQVNPEADVGAEAESEADRENGGETASEPDTKTDAEADAERP